MLKILKKDRKIGLAWQLTLAIMIGLVLPIIIVIIAYFNIFESSILKEANKKMQLELRKITSSMDRNSMLVDSVFSKLDFEHELPFYLDPDNVLSAREINYYGYRVQEILQSVRFTYPNMIDNIAIYSKNGQIDRNSDWSFYFSDLKKATFYDEIRLSGLDIIYGKIRKPEYVYPNLSDRIQVQNIDALILPIYKRIYNYQNKKQEVGVVELNIEISKYVDFDNASLDQDTKYLLFDEDGTCIYAKNLDSDEDFHTLDFKKESGTMDAVIGGKSYMIMFDHDVRTRLIRAVALDKAQVILPARQMSVKLIMIALISIVAIMYSTHLIVRIKLKRLLIMDRMMARIEDGDFTVHINEQGYDEIARIASSFNHMTLKIQKMLVSAVEEEKAKKDAQLKALQAQINPHFLYNTLENMRMQCEIDGYYSVGDSLAQLGELFRYSVKWDAYEVSFDLEWKNLKNYISIMRMRFCDDLECNLECEEEVMGITVPKLILQPLVENCFNHGFKNVITAWVLNIKAFKVDDELIIIIEDNGRGIGEERLKKIQTCIKENQMIYDEENQRSSIGVINVKQRIDMVCKKGSQLEIESVLGKGTRIIVTIKI